eukprot:s1469_g9.t2
MWLLLTHLTLLTGAAAQAANEVGLSLSKAAKVSNSASAQAHAEIATMTRELKLKQKQYSSAKVQFEQLIKEEKTLGEHTDKLEHQESRMEERLKAQGSASNKVTLARAQAQALQKKVLSTEAAVATVKQAIRHQQDALKSSEDELQRIKRKEEDFSEGTRLAVMKSNKLEQSLKEARTELQKQKANLTEQHEAARAAEARRDHAHQDEEREKAKNAAPLESHRGQVKQPINAHSINLAEQDVKHAENQLKDAQRQFKELRQQNPEGSAGRIFANLSEPWCCSYEQLAMYSMSAVCLSLASILATAAGVEWPPQVIQACALPSANAMVSDVEGSLTLSIANLCGAIHYPCRHQVFSTVQTMGQAGQDLYQCALPSDRRQELVMASFIVRGLRSQQYGQWGPWMGKAFASCPDLQGFQPKASTSYPTDDGTAVHFLVSGTGTAEKAGNIQQCLAQSIQASSGVGILAPRISVFDFSISQVESEPLFQIGMKNFMIILRFGAVLLVGLVVYGILAACAYFSGVKWLAPVLLCWPEVCDGRGCFVYRDAEFPPNDNSLGKLKGDTAGGFVHSGGGTDWVKASEIAEKDNLRTTFAARGAAPALAKAGVGGYFATGQQHGAGKIIYLFSPQPPWWGLADRHKACGMFSGVTRQWRHRVGVQLRRAAALPERWPERSVIHEPAWEKPSVPMPASIMNLANMFETYFVLKEVADD